ncbi:MAG: hypothetical protein ACI3W6_01925 [Clostridia bacterium]
MTIVYICTVLIFMLSFAANTIAAWKHPYFNIGKEESGKNGVFIRNMLFMGTVIVFMLVAINVGRYVHTNGFLYITLGYLLGVLFGNTFARRVLNRKYKDVVYEKYSVKKAREEREARALEEALALETAAAEGFSDDLYDLIEEDETEFCSGDYTGSSEDRGPRPPDHSKAHPWE